MMPFERLGGFQKVLDALSDAVVVVDPATRRCVYLNDSACLTFGVSAREALDGHPSVVASAWDDALLDDLETRLATDEAVDLDLDLDDRAYEVRWQHVDDLLAAVARDISGSRLTQRALRSALDHEQQAVDRLRETNALQRSFLGAVSHQLRTPMASVLGFSLTLRRIGELDDHQAVMVDRIVDNAQRLEGILADVFDLNRLAVDELRPEPTRCELAGLLERVRAEFPPPAAARVTVSVDGGAAAWCDPVMLERIVRNLLTNAVEYDHSAGPIEIRARSDHESCWLVVDDRGPGIPSGMHRRIFEPFLTGPDTEHAADPGTGVGLALVDRLARANGGRVVAEDRPGGGARFVVSLPAASPVATFDAERPGHVPAASYHASRVPTGGEGRSPVGDWEQLSIAAHELLNPLAIADGYAQLLAEAVDDARVDVPEFARRVSRNLELTRMVLQRIRDSELAPNQLALATERFDLASLVAEAADDLAVTVAASRPLDLEPAEVPLHVVADPARIRQVLFNLVSNASRYSPAGSPIHLRVRGAPHAIVEVRDHGRGIPPAEVERLFGRGQRLERDGRSRGLGLGLHVSRTIARAHGGELRFEPAQPHGSRFLLELPRATPPRRP
jgi:signal transduction histidine kinase